MLFNDLIFKYETARDNGNEGNYKVEEMAGRYLFAWGDRALEYVYRDRLDNFSKEYNDFWEEVENLVREAIEEYLSNI